MSVYKKVLSYLSPIIIQRTKGEHNNTLEVTLENGNLVLNTSTANYSFGSLHKVFISAFEKFKPNLSEKDEVLILGFGAGSVKYILRHDYHFAGKITGVEYDKKIIELAHVYFNIPKPHEKFNLLCADAFLFIQECKMQYPLIIVDLFNDLTIPKQFLQEIFIKKLSECITGNGFILWNFIGDSNTLLQLQDIIKSNKLNFSIYHKTINRTTNHIIKIYKP